MMVKVHVISTRRAGIRQRWRDCYCKLVGFGMSARHAFHHSPPVRGTDQRHARSAAALEGTGHCGRRCGLRRHHGTSTPLQATGWKPSQNRGNNSSAILQLAKLAFHRQNPVSAQLLPKPASPCSPESAIRIPPTINLPNADPDCDLDYVPNTKRRVLLRLCAAQLAVRRHDGALLFKKFEE